jgi:hypothetical protein
MVAAVDRSKGRIAAEGEGRMRRKAYATEREPKSDQLIGAIAFPLVNGVLALIVVALRRWAAASHGSFDHDPVAIGILVLPWAVNGFILALAFLFRPQIGVGYIASIAVILSAVVVLGLVFLGACAVSLPGWLLGPVGIVLFLVALVLGLIIAGQRASDAFMNWWAPAPEGKEEEARLPVTERTRGRLTNQQIQELFDRFAAPLFQAAGSPRQKEAAEQVAQVLWQALVTEPDHEELFFQTLHKAVGVSDQDLEIIKDRYYWEMKPKITEDELRALKEHYRVRRSGESGRNEGGRAVQT